MFQRSQQEQYQRLQDTRIDTMFQLVKPLQKYWPELVVLLNKHIENGANASRLGELLAEEFKKITDTLESEHQKKMDKQYWKARDVEQDLKNKIDQFPKEKQKYVRALQTLEEKNQEQAKQIRIQNTLLADLHRQISNLTGVEDSSTT